MTLRDRPEDGKTGRGVRHRVDATDWLMTFPVGVVILLGVPVYGIVALATRHISPADFLAAVTAGGGLLAIGHGVHHVATAQRERNEVMGVRAEVGQPEGDPHSSGPREP